MAAEWGYSLLRSYPLEDIQIDPGGDGRTVTAYAAIFDSPYEVVDRHGHYMEVVERSAFNRTLNGAGRNAAACLYNHGMTVHGTPDALASVPLGKPLEIRADTKGLITVTRYNDSPLADAVLSSIRNGDITSQSFRGQAFRSSPTRVPRVRDGEALPIVTRHELGLLDYGPTPMPVNAAAAILAVRSLPALLADVEDLDEDDRAELIRRLAPTTPPVEADPVDEPATPDPGLGAEDPPTEALRSAADTARRIRVAMLTRGITHGPEAARGTAR